MSEITSIEITKPQLWAAIAEWETESRLGILMTHEESLTLSVDEVSDLCTEHLWDKLVKLQSAQPS